MWVTFFHLFLHASSYISFTDWQQFLHKCDVCSLAEEYWFSMLSNQQFLANLTVYIDNWNSRQGNVEMKRVMKALQRSRKNVECNFAMNKKLLSIERDEMCRSHHSMWGHEPIQPQLSPKMTKDRLKFLHVICDQNFFVDNILYRKRWEKSWCFFVLNILLTWLTNPWIFYLLTFICSRHPWYGNPNPDLLYKICSSLWEPSE